MASGLSLIGYAYSPSDVAEAISKAKGKESLVIDRAELLVTPPAMYQLTQLTAIDLSDNQLSKLEGMEAFSRLKALVVSSNILVSLPTQICFLQLTRLILDSNNITALPNEIGGMTSLVELDLGNNHLSWLPVSFVNLSNLEKLNLRNNTLYISDSLCGLQALKCLHLDSNRLETLCLNDLPKLLKVTAKKNPIDKIELKNTKPVIIDIDELEKPDEPLFT